MPKGQFCVDIWKGESNNVVALKRDYVVETETGCWQWTGAKLKNGYAKVTVFYKTLLAHRFFFEEIRKTTIPKGMQIDHLCRNRSCVNPDHLEVVTPRVNSLRSEGFAAKNFNKTHCDNGHLFTEENTYVPPRRPTRRYCRACNRTRQAEFMERKLAQHG